MNTISALFGSAIAAIGILLAALLFGGCTQQITPPAEERIPVIPTTMVYSIEAPGEMNREEIAFSKPASRKPETFRIEGNSQTIQLAESFENIESDTFDIFNAADLALQDEIYDADDNRRTTFDNDRISVLKAVACKSILDHIPQHETSQFTTSDDHAFLFTQVAMRADLASRIWHIWKKDGITQLQVELAVKGPTYRTGSCKKLDAHSNGHWAVEVTTDNGEVLEAVEFEVQ